MPRFIILDDDLLAEFPRIQKVYESMYTKNDLLEILELPTSRMKSEIINLPPATKDVLSKMISTEIASGRLDSISKVRV